MDTHEEDVFDQALVDVIDRPYQPHEIRKQLRALRHMAPNGNVPLPGDPAMHQMVIDLLRLPEEVDPLQWLEKNIGGTGAAVKLSRALSQCVPPHPDLFGPPVRVLRPNATDSVTSRNLNHSAAFFRFIHLNVSVKEVILGKSGLLLDIRSTITSSPTPHEDNNGIVTVWSGFDTIEDNFHHTYLIGQNSTSWQNSSHATIGVSIVRLKTEQILYPGLSYDVEELILSSNPARLSIYAEKPNHSKKYSDELTMDGFTQRIALNQEYRTP